MTSNHPEAVQSPRNAALERQLAEGGGRALEAFWCQVADEGTPLIEPIPRDDRHVLLTFLWRADGDTQSVVLIGGVAHADFAQSQLTRLGTTDCWYRTYRVRQEARFIYQLSPNDPLVSLFAIEESGWHGASFFRPDPLNKQPFAGASSVTLPGAPAQPWIGARAGVPAGEVREHTFASTILQDERKVWVYRVHAKRPGATGAPL